MLDAKGIEYLQSELAISKGAGHREDFIEQVESHLPELLARAAAFQEILDIIVDNLGAHAEYGEAVAPIVDEFFRKSRNEGFAP